MASAIDGPQLDELVIRLQIGDQQAAEALLSHAYARLRSMARSLTDGFPSVRRWEESDDIWHEAVIKLHRHILQSPPESARHFFSLASRQIRWTLIEAIRRLNGPLGLGANHDTQGSSKLSAGADLGGKPAGADTHDPVSLSDWAEFHCQVESLPDELREVFGLLWYGGLSQEDAAVVLGVSVRTLRRRWRHARLRLAELRCGQCPG